MSDEVPHIFILVVFFLLVSITSILQKCVICIIMFKFK